MTEIQTISDLAGVRELARKAADAEHLGVDSESNSMHAFRERVCLIQLSIDDEYFIIDPLAFEDSRQCVEPLRECLEAPGRSLVLHGGEYDVAVFKREFDLPLRGVFDTQQAATFLGWSRTGLGSLVEEICGVKLGKAYARHDWGRRPLEPEPLAYAMNDVRYLRRMHEHLTEAVEAADLVEEVAIANAAVEGAAAHRQSFDPAGYWKTKGVRELDPAGRQRMQALWAWREGAAKRADQPAGRLVNPQQLLALARRPPNDEAALVKLRMPGPLRRKEGASLLAALREAEANPPDVLPAPRGKRRDTKLEPEVAAREKRLKAWRRKEAEAREVPISVVLPGRALTWIADDPTRDWSEAPQLGPKRLDRYGDAMRACIDEPAAT